jgi:hypothetical protein
MTDPNEIELNINYDVDPDEWEEAKNQDDEYYDDEYYDDDY